MHGCENGYWKNCVYINIIRLKKKKIKASVMEVIVIIKWRHKKVIYSKTTASTYHKKAIYSEFSLVLVFCFLFYKLYYL